METPHTRLLIFATSLVCSAGMALPISGFPNLAAANQEDELGQRCVARAALLSLSLSFEQAERAARRVRGSEADFPRRPSSLFPLSPFALTGTALALALTLSLALHLTLSSLSLSLARRPPRSLPSSRRRRYLYPGDFYRNGVPASIGATAIVITIGYAIMRLLGL